LRDGVASGSALPIVVVLRRLLRFDKEPAVSLIRLGAAGLLFLGKRDEGVTMIQVIKADRSGFEDSVLGRLG